MDKVTRIELLEGELWLMEFKDHWTPKDWKDREEMQRELRELKKE